TTSASSATMNEASDVSARTHAFARLACSRGAAAVAARGSASAMCTAIELVALPSPCKDQPARETHRCRGDWIDTLRPNIHDHWLRGARRAAGHQRGGDAHAAGRLA